MSPSARVPHFSLVAVAAGLAAIAYVFGERFIAGAALVIGLLVLCAAAFPALDRPGGGHVVRLLGLSWTMEDFLTHWIVVGRSGSGKTAGVIRTLLIQLMHSTPGFGCIAIDEKANFHKVLAGICAANGQPDKLIVLRPRLPGREPQALANTMNLIGDRTISWETYAQLVIDTAVACGQETNNSFFKNQGRKTIAAIFATLEAIDQVPTLGDAYDFIAENGTYDRVIEKLEERTHESARCAELLGFWMNFSGKAGDEKSGIKSTTELYLYPYSADALRDLFGDPNPTLELRVIDDGKILCPSIPQAFLTQRRYVIAWFKFAGYYHLLRRFDDFDEAARSKLTPIVLLADEGQNSILAAEEGMADHNTLDKIREARGTLILAMQSYSSMLPALKGRRDLAETVITNLNNHVIGAIRDETGREMAANIFGKDWHTEKSHSYGGKDSTVMVKRELRHIFHTGIFTRLPQFKCIVFHVSGRWVEGYIPPLTDDGKRVSLRYRLGSFRRLFAV
jgi:hypothetical protein